MSKVLAWEELRLPEIELALADRPVVIFPIGATEQHGGHLPEDTDTHIARALAYGAGAAASSPAIVLPSLPFGCSTYHMNFAGTLTLSQDTFIAVVCEICRCVWQHGARDIILLNAHGGNSAILDTITRRLSDESIWTVSVSWWNLIRQQLAEERDSPIGGMNHACEMETSIELHLRPELVRMEDAVDEIWTAPVASFGGDLVAGGTARYPTAVDRVSRSGVMGMPSVATARKGERWFDAAVAALAELIDSYRQAARPWETEARSEGGRGD